MKSLWPYLVCVALGFVLCLLFNRSEPVKDDEVVLPAQSLQTLYSDLRDSRVTKDVSADISTKYPDIDTAVVGGDTVFIDTSTRLVDMPPAAYTMRDSVCFFSRGIPFWFYFREVIYYQGRFGGRSIFFEEQSFDIPKESERSFKLYAWGGFGIDELNLRGVGGGEAGVMFKKRLSLSHTTMYVGEWKHVALVKFWWF